jgi:hypothetical protein
MALEAVRGGLDLPMSDYDGLVRDWNAAAGDQLKREYAQAMASAS